MHIFYVIMDNVLTAKEKEEYEIILGNESNKV